MLLFFQESNRNFRTSSENTFQATNIIPIGSKSGKMTKLKNCIKILNSCLPDDDVLLLTDSWAGYNDNSMKKNKKIETLTIPSGIKKYIQPLDVHFFRICKSFIRKFSEKIFTQTSH